MWVVLFYSLHSIAISLLFPIMTPPVDGFGIAKVPDDMSIT
jgi:hypothetical protein